MPSLLESLYVSWVHFLNFNMEHILSSSQSCTSTEFDLWLQDKNPVSVEIHHSLGLPFPSLATSFFFSYKMGITKEKLLWFFYTFIPQEMRDSFSHRPHNFPPNLAYISFTFVPQISEKINYYWCLLSNIISLWDLSQISETSNITYLQVRG